MAAGREGPLVASAAGAPAPYRAAAIDYGGNYGAAQHSPSANGVFIIDRAVKFSEITDGASHTLAVAEDVGRGWLMDGEWVNGENIFDMTGLVNSQQHDDLWSDHPGLVMSLYCDGSVAAIGDVADVAVVRAACTRASDEPP
jgi:hypothetical protein